MSFGDNVGGQQDDRPGATDDPSVEGNDLKEMLEYFGSGHVEQNFDVTDDHMKYQQHDRSAEPTQVAHRTLLP